MVRLAFEGSVQCAIAPDCVSWKDDAEVRTSADGGLTFSNAASSNTVRIAKGGSVVNSLIHGDVVVCGDSTFAWGAVNGEGVTRRVQGQAQASKRPRTSPPTQCHDVDVSRVDEIIVHGSAAVTVLDGVALDGLRSVRVRGRGSVRGLRLAGRVAADTPARSVRVTAEGMSSIRISGAAGVDLTLVASGMSSIDVGL